MTESPIIAHISDNHVLDPRRPPGADERLDRVLRAIRRREDPSRLVIWSTGDECWSGTRDEWLRVQRGWRAARWMRIIWSQGNHDWWEHGLFVLPGTRRFARWRRQAEKVTGRKPPPAGKLELQVFRGTLFISANSSWRRNFLASGSLGTDQIRSIARHVEKARGRGLRVVLGFHHCPSGGRRRRRLNDRHELSDALEAAGGVDLMLTGHLHRARVWRNEWGADWLISSPGAVLDFRIS